MYNPTFIQHSLDRQIRKSDFKTNKSLNLENPNTREALVKEAVEIAKNGFTNFNLKSNDIAGRKVYTLNHFPTQLVLRKATENLSKISSAKQSSRLDIIQRMTLFSSEGLAFSIAKFDITQFYQSIDHNELRVMLHRRLSTAPSTKLVLDNFLDKCSELGIEGLPAGLSLSATLAEMYMQDFDVSMSLDPDTIYYARYVDDIIVFGPFIENKENLQKKVIDKLPKGLLLNLSKTNFYKFTNTRVKQPKTEHKFDYLGFSFDVSQITKDKPFHRRVIVDISQSKINKIKTRIVKSILQFKEDHNFDDLNDRFKIICGNYKFYDHSKSRNRLAGISHTYSLIQEPSTSLGELDKFKNKLLLSKSGKVCSNLRLNNNQKNKLLGLSFSKCYTKSTHFHFSPNRLKKLMECWKYV